MENERLDIRLLKITIGFNLYRSVLFLISLSFYIVCFTSTLDVINGTISNQDITFYYVSILITVFSIPLIIFAPIYANKLFPFLFKRYLLVSNKRIVYITKKKKQEILLKDVDLVYKGDNILGILFDPAWSCLQVRYKGDVKDKKLLMIFITGKQYSQIINTIQ